MYTGSTSASGKWSVGMQLWWWWRQEVSEGILFSRKSIALIFLKVYVIMLGYHESEFAIIPYDRMRSFILILIFQGGGRLIP